MPAFTNSRVGSSSRSEADGTAVCAPRRVSFSKCATKFRLISAVSISPALLFLSCRQLRWSMRRDRQALTQLRFGLGLALGDLVAEHPDADREAVEPVL